MNCCAGSELSSSRQAPTQFEQSPLSKPVIVLSFRPECQLRPRPRCPGRAAGAGPARGAAAAALGPAPLAILRHMSRALWAGFGPHDHIVYHSDSLQGLKTRMPLSDLTRRMVTGRHGNVSPYWRSPLPGQTGLRRRPAHQPGPAGGHCHSEAARPAPARARSDCRAVPRGPGRVRVSVTRLPESAWFEGPPASTETLRLIHRRR